MSDLKPCPFCGGEAELEKSSSGSFTVGCSDWENCIGFWTSCNYFKTEAEAIAAWNERAEHRGEPPYDSLIRCLEKDWNISATWDGLRKFWNIELTDEGVRLRDSELDARAERTCHDDNIGFSFVCSECGANVKDTYVGRSYVDKFGKRWYATSNGQAFNYCPNCGAKVIGG